MATDTRAPSFLGRPEDALFSDILAGWAASRPDKAALVFLEDGRTETETLTYAQLHRRAGLVAEALMRRGLVGERVLLLYPSCTDYVVTFLGCLYAGVIAVPVFPPRQSRHARRLAAIAEDATAKAVLGPDVLVPGIESTLRELECGIDLYLGTEALLAELPPDSRGWHNERTRADEVAYLQYTSGSTGTPKGVMVAHRNLLSNCRIYSDALGVRDIECFVSWLPIFHDLGLVQGISMPLTLGATAVFMPPAQFVQQPIHWLRAIDHYRGGFTAAPNFAFELCVKRVSPEEAATLDLSSWKVALNGAEPLIPATLRRFRERFGSCGFDPTTFSGGYGLAEATLYVTCGRRGELSPERSVKKSALEQDRIEFGASGAADCLTYVSSGHVLEDSRVRIVSPQTGLVCAPGEVGEIWVAGSSVCEGYWKRPEESVEMFHASLAGDPAHYLRTGDLGFVDDGQLYVTGRLKDLIIVRGANHYPQDIEQTVEVLHPHLRHGGWNAVFLMDTDNDAKSGGTRLVIVQEVEREARSHIDCEALGRMMADAVTEAHGIDLDMVVFVPPGSVPKTSSGKIQRRNCRQQLIDGELKAIGHWQRPAADVPMQTSGVGTDLRDIERWLAARVAALGGHAANKLPLDQPFSALGLDSLRLVEFIGETARHFGCTLSPSVAFEYPTIRALATHLAGSAARTVAGARDVEPIAIIGMGCRFPEANDTESFWRLLVEGRSGVATISDARRDLTGYRAAADAPFRFGGFIDDVDCFDAAVFNISAREAASMDPQQRLLLETTWHALEDASIAPTALAGSATGVFVGICGNDYFRSISDTRRGDAALDGHAGTGGATSIAANRISYCLGLQGPSLAIDTACSSSLVAVHQACASLANGESSLALAAGVNLILRDDYGRIFTHAGMLAPDGQCKTFDAGANGYVRGEGCGVLVLKRLADAQRDGDAIHAVIRGSAVNQDGYSNGLTAPNGLAQQRVIRAALERAGVDAGSIGFVETHGTGTSLGDPVEVRALRAVYDTATDVAAPPCWLGAVKTNIGHLEAAAGVAGLIKATLVLRHGELPPNRNFNALNPLIELQGGRLRLPTERTTWPRGSQPRRAAVSSFGFGGTNAHVILEEPPSVPSTTDAASDLPQAPQLIALSAKSETALRRLATAYADRASRGALPAICRSANGGRARLEERLVVCADDADDLRDTLHRYAREGICGEHAIRDRADGSPRLAWMFSGQGTHYTGMGRELYRQESSFRHAIERCDLILEPLLGVSIKHVLFDGTGLLDDTRYAQPAIAALQIALATQWRDWGIHPEWVCGHSVGEYAAAHVAGIMDLSTALTLVVHRARLMASAPGVGRMVSVSSDAQSLMDALAGDFPTLSVAAFNSPNQTVLSGPVDAMDAALARLDAQSIRHVSLPVSHAFHSPLMDPILDDFAMHLGNARLDKPSIAFIATGGSTDADPSRPEYWVRQIREPVRFMQALSQLRNLGADTFLELGPDAVLCGLGRRQIEDSRWTPSLRVGASESIQLRMAAATLHAAGMDLDFRRIDGDGPRGGAPLYPFDRTRHWFETPAIETPTAVQSREESSTLLGHPLDLASETVRIFESRIVDPRDMLRDHRVQGRAVLPGAAYVSLLLMAAGQLVVGRHEIVDLRLTRAIELDDAEITLQTILTRASPLADHWSVHIASRSAAGPWLTNASAEIRPDDETADVGASAAILGATNVDADSTDHHADAFYARWSEVGLQYGPAFRGVVDLSHGGDRVDAWLKLPHAAASTSGRFEGGINPALLDAAFQTLGGLLLDEAESSGRMPLPVGISRVRMHRTIPSGLVRVRAGLRARETERMVADLQLETPDGVPLLTIEGLVLTWISPREVDTTAGATNASTYEIAWTGVTRRERVNRSGRWLIHGVDAADTLAVELSLQHAGSDAGAIESATTAEDLLRILSAAIRRHRPAGLLIVPPEERRSADGDPTDDAIEGCRRLQSLLLALAETDGVPEGFQIALVSRDACAAESGTRRRSLSITHSAIAGFWRAAACEYPQWSFRHIDLPAGTTPSDWSMLPEAIECEENCIAVRDGSLLAPRLRHARLDAQATTLDPSALYLVAGGSGALGLHAAAILVERGARHVCLTARHLDGGATRHAVAGWQHRGVEVLLLPADVSDADDVRRLFASLREYGRPLRGVIHAAGVNDDHALPRINGTSWRQVFAAKARGAWLLDRQTRGMHLDFFIGYSSMAAVLGSAGQCNYAAANAMHDAVMDDRRQAGEVATAVHWGPWAGGGMASHETLHEAFARSGLSLLSVDRGAEVLRSLLATPRSDVLVVDVDWNAYAAAAQPRAQNAEVPSSPSLLRELTARSAAPAAAMPSPPEIDALADMDSAQARKAICAHFGGLLAAVLKADAVALHGDHARFMNTRLSSLGIDSLMAMEVRNRVRGWVGVDLPAHLLIGGNPVADVIDLIHQKVLLRAVSRIDDVIDDTREHDDDREEMVL